MENLGYYNGRFDLIENMMIPMTDRACWFGDGVYEAAYARNHIIFALDEPLDRLFASAVRLEIEIPYSKGELTTILNEMVAKVDDDELFVYWQVTRGSQPRRSHGFEEGMQGNLWITVSPGRIDSLEHGLSTVTCEDIRFLMCDVKTLNLIPNCMAVHAADRLGCDEAILHRDGIVTECSHSNVHILKDGVLKTHPADNLILHGIARAHLIRLCARKGIPVDETAFDLAELYGADEVIVTSSGMFAGRVDSIDGKQVGGGAPGLLESLQHALMEEFLQTTEVQDRV